jgi:hypothetical protein
MIASAMIIAAVFTATEAPEPAFTIRMPSEKIGYPGVEYWATIEGPGGKNLWSFAIYTGKDAWTVPLRPHAPGTYRLTRVEKRDGDKRIDVELTEVSPVRIDVAHGREFEAAKPGTLVEAGEFNRIFAAEEPWCINDHTIVQGPDNTWHLFAITHPKPLDFFKDPGRRLAHATATSLRQDPWQAQPPAVTADWEKCREYLLWAPHVIRSNSIYYMFVCAGDKESHKYRIHLLTSPDLKTWTRSPNNPMVVDGFDGRDPMVLHAENQWIMYYTATSTPDGGNHTVACVTSSDLTHWSDRKVVFVHPNAGTFGGPTESPFVVQRGRHYYLFICDNDWTHVYLSRDPFHWEIEQRVGRIRSHASEVIRDASGRWYITHAGWMSGPVSVAPLEWKDDLDGTPSSIPPAVR